MFWIKKLFSAEYLDTIFQVESIYTPKKKEEKTLYKRWRFRRSLCTLSTDMATLFAFDAVACAGSSWKGSSWCKAENLRYKCRVRFRLFIPAFSLRPVSLFVTEGGTVSFVIARRYTVSLLPLTLFPLLLSSLLSRISNLFLTPNHPPSSIFQLPRNFDSSWVSFEHTYIHSHRSKVSLRWSFSPLCCPPFLPLPPISLSPFPRLSPVRNNKRSTRGETSPRSGRNRADLRPGSEKAIWANRTPPTGGRSSG